MGDILMTYKEELAKAMNMLSENEKVLFLGQCVSYPGTSTGDSFKDIPESKKIELPIIEDAQMGMCVGLSLEGFIPISIYPRMDFLIIALNQIANHLDKIEEMSNGEFKPKVIIRTSIGAKKPLYPGAQHCGDYTEALKLILKNIEIVKLNHSNEILPAYEKALKSDKSTILIEEVELYLQK